MDSQAFLKYLVSLGVLTETQVEQCWQECHSTKKTINQVLPIYAPREVLSQSWRNFQQKNQEISQGNLAIDTSLPTSEIISEIETISRNTKRIQPQKNRDPVENEAPTLSVVPSSQINSENRLSPIEEDAQTLPFAPSSITSEEETEDKGTVPFGVNSSETDEQTRFQNFAEEYKLESEAKFSQERYEVLETLGQGGMGVVQRVQDNLLGREVALKKIKMDRFGLESLSNKQQIMLWRLNREAEITAILEHPNIVPLYDMQQQSDGELYFTMRKIEGDTLTSILNKKRNGASEYDENELLSIFFKISDAISYSHNRGVIHRDLKPDNIMVGQFGEVYVMDWGIAKKLTDFLDPQKPLKNTMNITSEEYYHTIGGLGTPGYMAPEQAENASKVKPQSDIFSLGIILRQCYILLSPIEELRLQQKNLKSKKNSEKYKEELKKKVPLDIQAIIEKATDQQWSKRYASVQALESDIRRYLKNVRVSVREYNLWEILVKWGQRNWRLLLITASICLFLGLFWEYSQRLKRQEVERQTKERQETFQKYFQQAEAEKTLALTATNKNQKVGIRIKHLLKALNYLNLALSTMPNSKPVEQEKLAISEQLIALACMSQDYQLADYLATELDSLRIIGKKKKAKIKENVEFQRNSMLTNNLKRFNYWVERLKKEQLEKDIHDNAIFEISKMQQKEIYEKLVSFLKEGTHYFTQTQKRSLVLNQFYKTMAMALGRLENEEATILLFDSLEKMAQKYSKFSVPPVAEIEFMVSLSYALVCVKASDVAKKFYGIRMRMGINRLFWKQTRTIYKELLLIEDRVGEEEPKDIAEVKPPSKTAKDYYEEAQKAYYLDDYKTAIALYTKAIEITPRAEFFNARGRVKNRLNDLTGAIQDYNESIKLESKNPGAYKNRGRAKFRLGDDKGALEDFNKTLNLAPRKFARVFGERGQIRHSQGDFEGALIDFNESIRLEPQRYLNYIYRGNLRRHQKQMDKALADYEKAIRLAPKEIDGYLSRGILFFEQKQMDKALQDFDKVIQMNPKKAVPFYHRGIVKMNKGDFKGAIVDLQEAVRLQPTFAEAYFNLGVCYRRLKDLDQSIEAFQKGIALKKHRQVKDNLVSLLAARAKSYIKQKKYKKARKDLVQGLQFISKSDSRFQELKQILKQVEAEIQKK